MRVFLCEKPSQGKDIARVLGAGHRGNGCYSGAGVVVTWCIGHLVEAVPPEGYGDQYKRWAIEQLPILPERWRVEPKAATAAQFKVVQQLVAKAGELVIATDADREGEMIAREIIDLCGYHGPIQRLWLSALNDASIRKALGALKPSAETLPLYYSALARSRADWLIGMNLSRLFTLLGRQAGYTGVLSVGRVQTPTLKLVVDRDREIARFVSVPYWAVDVLLSHAGRSFTASWIPPEGSTDAAGRCLQQPVAQQAADCIRAARDAQVVSVDTERVREAPPLPFDLGTLQEVCSKQLGLDVQETLDIAQALYETHKATTYPRSDSGYLPESMLAEVPAVLDALLATDPSLRPLIGQLDRNQRSRAWNDGKVTAHHGIIPTLEPANLSAMNEKELAVYRLIRAHYLAQFLPHHEFDRTVAQFSCGSQSLAAVGKQIAVTGWREVLATPGPDDADGEDAQRSQVLPALHAGLSCPVGKVDLKALKTLPSAHTGSRYARHAPERTLLYALVQAHYPDFIARLEAEDRPLPEYVREEFETYLRCGVLEHGFLRVVCEHCRAERLVAFSCKKRGFCPSCGARRMAESARHLVEEVFGPRPVRQWVLSFPYPLRFLFASKPEAISPVLGIVHRVIAGWLADQAGIDRASAQCGAVTLIQRFGSALNLNVHFHMLWLDGVYVEATELPRHELRLHRARAPTTAQLTQLAATIAHRVCRHLTRKGWLEGEGESAFLADSAAGDDSMDGLRMGSITYRIATGRDAGCKVVTLQTLPGDAGSLEGEAGKVGGFSLHAGVAAEAHESHKLEKLCRYITRPAISEKRLSIALQGRVRYQLKTPWRNGTTHVEWDAVDFIAKLAALVPPPRAHLTRFHGVFAPNANLRAQLTPSGRGKRPAGDAVPVDVSAHDEPRSPEEKRRSMSWAQRLKRVFSIDITTCAHCGGAVRIVASIEEPTAIRAIRAILAHFEKHGALEQAHYRPAARAPPPAA